eukprot:2697877-Pyramimonas_sp.AAC.1
MSVPCALLNATLVNTTRSCLRPEKHLRVHERKRVIICMLCNTGRDSSSHYVLRQGAESNCKQVSSGSAVAAVRGAQGDAACEGADGYGDASGTRCADHKHVPLVTCLLSYKQLRLRVLWKGRRAEGSRFARQLNRLCVL